MKRYSYIIVLFIACCFAACTEFLDVAPEGVITPSSFFATDADATAAMTTVYNQALHAGDDNFDRAVTYEIFGTCDDFILGRTRGDNYYNMCNYNYAGTEESLVKIWNSLTKALSYDNWLVMSLVKKGNLSDIEKNRLGEAYFMRAFIHFQLAYRYGRPDQGFPFDRYEDPEYYEYPIPEQRATVMENYALIIQDLESAAELLPFVEDYAQLDKARAHKAACWAYMAKVYAYWAQHDPSKWSLVPALVDKVENEGHRGLLDNFADVFKIENNFSKEQIFNIAGALDINSGRSCWLPGLVLQNQGWGKTNGWGFYKPTLGLYEEYAEGDKRRPVTILEYGDKFIYYGEEMTFWSAADLESGFQVGKYMEPFIYGETDENGVGINGKAKEVTCELAVPLIRFAELVLFKAEAEIMLGQNAATTLNRISRRAGLGDIYSNPTMKDLMHERRCELACEFSDRLQDLRRWQGTAGMPYAADALAALNAPKIGRHYENRSDPYSTWEPIEIWAARNFNPATDIAYPYPPDEVVKANGKLKQNPIGN